MARREFADRRANEHLALVAALFEACRFCERPENRDRLLTLLARPEYVGVAGVALRPGVSGRFDFGHGCVRSVPEFNIFHNYTANEPSGEKVAWVLRHMRDTTRCPDSAALNLALGRRIFRADLFEEAMRRSEAAPVLNDGGLTSQPEASWPTVSNSKPLLRHAACAGPA